MHHTLFLVILPQSNDFNKDFGLPILSYAYFIFVWIGVGYCIYRGAEATLQWKRPLLWDRIIIRVIFHDPACACETCAGAGQKFGTRAPLMPLRKFGANFPKSGFTDRDLARRLGVFLRDRHLFHKQHRSQEGCDACKLIARSDPNWQDQCSHFHRRLADLQQHLRNDQ